MNLELNVQYYLKAMDYYPFNLEFTIENLQYALSYDPDHAQSLCLLGEIYMYNLKEYSKAKECFERSIAGNLDYPDHYKHLSILHMWLGEFDSAEKIIDFALKRKGMSQEFFFRLKGQLFEYQGRYRMAKHFLKKAKEISQHKKCLDAIQLDLKRVKAKQNKLKKGKLKSKSAKK